MEQLKDSQIKSLKDGEIKVESLGRRNGAMVFQRTKKVIACYYRYWKGRKRTLIKIDIYRMTPKSPGMKLDELRDKALELAAIRKRIDPIDLKDYLTEQDEELKSHAERKKQKKDEESKLATLQDLMEAYIASLEERDAVSFKNTRGVIKNNILEPYPELARKKVRDFQTEDFIPLLGDISNRGAPHMYNRVRGTLQSAFNFAIKADFDPMLQAKHKKKFRIKHNPVMPISRAPSEGRKREISHEEIRQLWDDIDKGLFSDRLLYGLFVKFCFSCFGTRLLQLARVKWSDVNLDERTLTFYDYKGYDFKPRKQIIPLTQTAIGILEEVRRCNGSTYSPDRTLFSSSDQATLNTTDLSIDVLSYNRVESRCRERLGMEPYRPDDFWLLKDIRRTATGIMTSARIIKEHRYLLQSRSDGSIESRHYDVSDRMDEKREAAEKYEAMLKQILNPEASNQSENLRTDKPVTDSYSDFKQIIVSTGTLKTQRGYIRDGYRDRQVRGWFKQLETEGLIQKNGQGYILTCNT